MIAHMPCGGPSPPVLFGEETKPPNIQRRLRSFTTTMPRKQTKTLKGGSRGEIQPLEILLPGFLSQRISEM